MGLRIGSVELTSNLALAPLAGYTSLPFRVLIRELGGLGLAVSEMVNARSLIENNRNALKLIETAPGDQPLAVQLFGAVPEEMRDAAGRLAARGVPLVDVNMGCPVPKVCKAGAGAVMMKDPAKAARLLAAMTGAVRIPVICKIRLGWDAASPNAPDFARALEDAGAAAVTVHGRTAKQGFSGKVDLAGIRAVVRAVKRIPVIGNGDVTTPQAARTMLEETGCAGLAIGRGAFHDPWIFRRIQQLLATGEFPAPASFDDRVGLMQRHLDQMREVFGEESACRMFRKIGILYARGLGPSIEFRRQITLLRSRAHFDEILAGYRQWRETVLSRKMPAQ